MGILVFNGFLAVARRLKNFLKFSQNFHKIHKKAHVSLQVIFCEFCESFKKI